MGGIVILAMVALFLGLRLYSVLGKRTGHEQTFTAPEPAVVPAPVADAPTRALPPVTYDLVYTPEAASGMRAIIAAEPSFDVGHFLDGARGAYRQVLEAYWQGDETRLAELVHPHVAEGFSAAIHARQAAGETLDNRLVSIGKALIVGAEVDGREAHITVDFDADIAAVTRDRDGKVVAGSLSDAVTTRDVWTFSRTLRSSDPSWILSETAESA